MYEVRVTKESYYHPAEIGSWPARLRWCFVNAEDSGRHVHESVGGPPCVRHAPPAVYATAATRRRLRAGGYVPATERSVISIARSRPRALFSVSWYSR